MSAVMAHFARDEGIDIKLQLLVVGAFDFRQVPATGKGIDNPVSYESFSTYQDVPWGPLGRLQWFMDQWVGTDPGEYYLEVLFFAFQLKAYHRNT